MYFTSNNNFTISTPNTDTHSDQESMEILNDVLETFEKHVPIASNRVCHVIDNPDFDSPMYLDDQKTILLTTTGSTYWSQNVYQFAHELCHYAIHTGIQHDEFKWFEEVVCDLSSHYFLEEMAKKWQESQDGQKYNYSASFKEYSENHLNKIKKIKLKDVSNSHSDISKQLRDDRYNRKINTYITTKLLPIFRKHPKIWTDVPQLSKVNNFFSLNHFFNSWMEFSSDEGKEAITKIKHQFGV